MDAMKGMIISAVAVLILITFGIVGVQAAYQTTGTGGPPADWWMNDTYHYRQSISVHNNDNLPYAPVPVNILITYRPEMNADFSDLNAVHVDGTPTGTQIPLAINSKLDGNWANVTFLLPGIAAHGTENVYVYYGD